MFIILSEREVQPFILSSEGVVQCLFYRKKSVFVQCFDSSVGFFLSIRVDQCLFIERSVFCQCFGSSVGFFKYTCRSVF